MNDIDKLASNRDFNCHISNLSPGAHFLRAACKRQNGSGELIVACAARKVSVSFRRGNCSNP
jgi:hypothetical protein